MKSFQKLSLKENVQLLKFPVYISLLAANSDGRLDKEEKMTAAKFSHIKTFSSDPLLTNFYAEADKNFEKNIEELENSLPEGKDNREKVISRELAALEKIVAKLGEEYVFIMHKSMKSFKEHVSRSHRNVLVDFIFPVPLEGLND
ncbi:MAG: hypothetical protein ABIU77_14715 [Ferruginibacter sp.]|jgi:hypothetical protein